MSSPHAALRKREIAAPHFGWHREENYKRRARGGRGRALPAAQRHVSVMVAVTQKLTGWRDVRGRRRRWGIYQD